MYCRTIKPHPAQLQPLSGRRAGARAAGRARAEKAPSVARRQSARHVCTAGTDGHRCEHVAVSARRRARAGVGRRRAVFEQPRVRDAVCVFAAAGENLQKSDSGSCARRDRHRAHHPAVASEARRARCDVHPAGHAAVRALWRVRQTAVRALRRSCRVVLQLSARRGRNDGARRADAYPLRLRRADRRRSGHLCEHPLSHGLHGGKSADRPLYLHRRDRHRLYVLLPVDGGHERADDIARVLL